MIKDERAHLQLALLPGLEAEGEAVGLAEEVVQPRLASLLGLGVGEHLVAERWHRLQPLLVALEERLELGQQLLPLVDIAELQHEVVVVGDSYQHHGLLAAVLGHLAHKVLHPLHTHAAQLLPLSVHQVEGLVGSELDLDVALGVVVEPLLDVHLVHRLSVVVLLPLGLDLPPPGVHDLDDPVGGAGEGQRDEDDDDAAEDVGNLGALEVVVS